MVHSHSPVNICDARLTYVVRGLVYIRYTQWCTAHHQKLNFPIYSSVIAYYSNNSSFASLIFYFPFYQISSEIMLVFVAILEICKKKLNLFSVWLVYRRDSKIANVIHNSCPSIFSQIIYSHQKHSSGPA